MHRDRPFGRIIHDPWCGTWRSGAFRSWILPHHSRALSQTICGMGWDACRVRTQVRLGLKSISPFLLPMRCAPLISFLSPPFCSLHAVVWIHGITRPMTNPFGARTEASTGQSFSSWRYMDEPTIDGDSYGVDSALLDQHNADSYNGIISSMAQFDGVTHQVSTGLPFDSYEHSFDAATLRQPRYPYNRNTEATHSANRSSSTTGTECSNEDEQRHVCQECNKLFRNLQELDQHTKRVPHKAWKCAEPMCGKTYARRDTFLRHRATHKDKSHSCPVCSRLNKQKVFARKDHLKEHIRNCHSKGIHAKSLDGVR